MGTSKILGLVILVIGLVLLFFGWQSTQSLGDQVAETFTGRFTDETMWYLIAGVASVVGGGVLLLKR